MLKEQLSAVQNPAFSQILYVSLSYSSGLILRSILLNILINGLHDEGELHFQHVSGQENSQHAEGLAAIEKAFERLEE